MPNLVVARLPDGDHDPELLNLVNRLQIHACGNYCAVERGGAIQCRFGYPFDINPEPYFHETTKRPVYERDMVDSFVNPYNPYLLKLLNVSMDIQVNYTGRVMYILFSKIHDKS